MYTCLLQENGHVWCWGRFGGVPNSPTTALPPTRVTPADGSLRFVSITAGAGAACGLTAEGRAYCWGVNLYGEVGDGTREGRVAPTPVDTDLRFTSLAAGVHVTCGLSTGGPAYCWGRADHGKLGNDEFSEGIVRPRPVLVAGAMRFQSLVGGLTFCGLTDAGTTLCWGGVPGTVDSDRLPLAGDCADRYYNWYRNRPCVRPTPLPAPSTFSSLAAGSNGPTHCGLTTDGNVRCWGEGWLGTLGNGEAVPGTHAVAPVNVSSALRFRIVAAGATHMCALAVDGSAHCWGNDFRGYLGDGGTLPRPSITLRAVPGPVVGGHIFSGIAGGAYHTCGMTEDDEVWCWGAGTEGQLGRSESLGDSSIPVRVDVPVR